MTSCHGVMKNVPPSRNYGVRAFPGCEESTEKDMSACHSGEVHRKEAVIVLTVQITIMAREQSAKTDLRDSIGTKRRMGPT